MATNYVRDAADGRWTLTLDANGDATLQSPNDTLETGSFSIGNGSFTTDLLADACGHTLGGYAEASDGTSLTLIQTSDGCAGRVAALAGVWRSPLAGIWTSAEVTPAQMGATLRSASLGRWAGKFPAQAQVGRRNVFLLDIHDGIWHQQWSKDGGSFQDNDYGQATVRGSEVVIHHPTGTDVFRWTIVGDQLTLTFVGTDMPASQGVPEEVYQRAFYTGFDFGRTG